MNSNELTIEFETVDEVAVFTTRVSSLNSFEQLLGEIPIYFNSLQEGCYLLTYSQHNKSPFYVYDEKSFEKMREDRPSKMFLKEFTDEVAKSIKLSDIPIVISQEFQKSEKVSQVYDSLTQKIGPGFYPLLNYVLFYSQEEVQKLRNSSQINKTQESRKLTTHENKKKLQPELKRKENLQPDMMNFKYHKKLSSDLGCYKKPLQDVTTTLKANSYVPLSQKFQSLEISNTSSLPSKKISKKEQEKLQSEVLKRHSKKLFSHCDESYTKIIKDLNKSWAKKFAALEAEMKTLKDCCNEQKKLLQSLSEQNSSHPLKMIDLCDDLKKDVKLPTLEKKVSAASVGIENKKTSQKLSIQKRLVTEPCHHSSEESSSSDSSEDRKRNKTTKDKYFEESDEESDSDEEDFQKNGLNSGQGRILEKNQKETQQKINYIISMFPQANPHQLNEIILKNPSLDINSIIIVAGLINS